MSRGPYPLLLTMALSTPGAANALGLGDLHVDSRLNQPLSAHIDILGATEQDLLSLSAAIANRDAFQKNGSDRPSFLSSAQFTVTQDQQHRPILSVRSSEPFTEPFVSLLIDLRWPNGSLVREYTLLLDPIGFESNSNLTSVVTSTVPPASSVLPVLTAAPAARDVAKVAESMDPVAPASSHKVSANQTLHGIARLAGARSSVDIRRTMIAIFRANPNAFDGNINRLHRDAVLTLPTPSQIADISKVEANREVRAQMVEWRLDGRPNVSSREGAPEEAPIANTTPAVVAIAAAPAAVEAGEGNNLNQRIQSLEQSLDQVKGQLARETGKLRDLQTQAAMTKPPVVEPAPRRDVDHYSGWRIASATGFGGLLLGLFLGLRIWRRNRSRAPASIAATPALAPTVETLVVESMPVASPATTGEVEEEAVEVERSGDTTMNLAINPTVAMKLDYNLFDLDATAQHVYMPSNLHEHSESTPFVERRKSVIDVLREAIEREPHRRELRLKLLELYYAAAATNQLSFLEVAKVLALDRDFLATGEWDRVAKMGRLIAAGDPVFLLDPDADVELSDREVSAA